MKTPLGGELFGSGRWPRCWIPGYDVWHFLLAAALAGVLAVQAWIPVTPVARRSAPSPPSPPVFLTPAPGFHWAADQLGVVEGLAPPGAWVRLYYGRQFLAQALVGQDGHFRFRLSGVPAGPCVLHAAAVRGNLAAWSAPLAFYVDAAGSPRRDSRRHGN